MGGRVTLHGWVCLSACCPRTGVECRCACRDMRKVPLRPRVAGASGKLGRREFRVLALRRAGALAMADGGRDGDRGHGEADALALAAAGTADGVPHKKDLRDVADAEAGAAEALADAELTLQRNAAGHIGELGFTDGVGCPKGAGDVLSLFAAHRGSFSGSGRSTGAEETPAGKSNRFSFAGTARSEDRRAAGVEMGCRRSDRKARAPVERGAA